MVINWLSYLVKIFFLPLFLLVVPLSALPADSGFVSSAQQLKAISPVSAPALNLPRLYKRGSNMNVVFKDRVTLVHFWASWCVPCRKEFPAIKRLHAYNAKEPFQIVTVAADNHKAVSAFTQKYKIDIPVIIDQYGKALRDYKVKALPSSFIIDKKGKIRYRATGHVIWDEPATRIKIKELLAK